MMCRTSQVFLIMFLLISSSSTMLAQSIVGVWETVDDNTELPTSHIEITERDGKYFGHVVKMLRDDPSALCVECSGKLKNQPIMGMTILRDMEKEEDYWSNGRILDPENGKEYKCNITLESKNKLILRGYIGAPIFGRSQNWSRVE